MAKEISVKKMEQGTRDYSRVAKAISYLEENARQQPSLDEVAEFVGLSPCHFQKLFSRWAGVSPKRFLQHLTAEEAKRRLLDSSVLDAALDAGLSGPGRLHDLLVNVEAMTPGQLKEGGKGLTIRYGSAASPFGDCFAAVTDAGITDLRFLDAGQGETAAGELRARWPEALLVEDNAVAGEVAGKIFTAGQKGPGSIKLCLAGTNLQVKVWKALLEIPEGRAVSYSQVARRAGRPDAVRAVASAVGQNPIAWLIPCHRVLRKSGAMGGYRWGVERKKAMLAREWIDST
jgi:AraC family transcriptional regulator of adaptative response/methylated-DNA-[protein]-cysteine methyltransferase